MALSSKNNVGTKHGRPTQEEHIIVKKGSSKDGRTREIGSLHESGRLFPIREDLMVKKNG